METNSASAALIFTEPAHNSSLLASAIIKLSVLDAHQRFSVDKRNRGRERLCSGELNHGGSRLAMAVSTYRGPEEGQSKWCLCMLLRLLLHMRWCEILLMLRGWEKLK